MRDCNASRSAAAAARCATRPMTALATPALSPETVLEVARLEGYANLDAETAARIAVGASHAVRAVTASVDGSLFDVEG